MKKYLIALALPFVVLASCKKTEMDNSAKINSAKVNSGSLIGTWELRSTYGCNILPLKLSPGNGNLVSFSEDRYSLFYVNGQITINGSYQLEHANGADCIVYDNRTALVSKDRFTISRDTLTLIPFLCDMGTRQYVKISDTPLTPAKQ